MSLRNWRISLSVQWPGSFIRFYPFLYRFLRLPTEDWFEERLVKASVDEKDSSFPVMGFPLRLFLAMSPRSPSQSRAKPAVIHVIEKSQGKPLLIHFRAPIGSTSCFDRLITRRARASSCVSVRTSSGRMRRTYTFGVTRGRDWSISRIVTAETCRVVKWHSIIAAPVSGFKRKRDYVKLYYTGTCAPL